MSFELVDGKIEVTSIKTETQENLLSKKKFLEEQLLTLNARLKEINEKLALFK